MMIYNGFVWFMKWKCSWMSWEMNEIETIVIKWVLITLFHQDSFTMTCTRLDAYRFIVARDVCWMNFSASLGIRKIGVFLRLGCIQEISFQPFFFCSHERCVVIGHHVLLPYCTCSLSYTINTRAPAREDQFFKHEQKSTNRQTESFPFLFQ